MELWAQAHVELDREVAHGLLVVLLAHLSKEVVALAHLSEAALEHLLEVLLGLEVSGWEQLAVALHL